MALETPRDQRYPTPTDEDYSRWRPSYHLIASKGWLNDPCAPGYDPATKTYHVGFQWNQKAAVWGDIVWGQARSSDLVSWDVSEEASLIMDKPYDHAGVFTGCWRPTGPTPGSKGEDNKELCFIYTSVSRLPIHYTLDYHHGCESLSIATSKNGGQTWEKIDANPILPGPPKELGVTGWRDPYVAAWPAMASILKEDADEGLFGIISGGIKDRTPTTFLYKVNPHDLTDWKYVAPVATPGLNLAPSRWTGDLGVNWEVTNFMSLHNGEHTQDFFVLGAEGCKLPYGGAGVVPGTKRVNRAQLWCAVDPNDKKSDDALMKFSYGGIFDHGLYYAANGFWDPITKQHVVIGWITDEDIPVELQTNQGWSGCLSLPRNVSLNVIPHVMRARTSQLADITSIKANPDAKHAGLFTIETMKIVPDTRLEKLRHAATKHEISKQSLGPLGQQPTQCAVPLNSAQWEACAELSCSSLESSDSRVGMVIHHHDSFRKTTLSFFPASETFVISRPDYYLPESYTGKDKNTKLQDETAPLTLFTTRDPATGVEIEERLRLRVFYDGSVLEVYVNERAVITTRVYLEKVKCTGLEFFGEAGSQLERAVVWDGVSAKFNVSVMTCSSMRLESVLG